MNTEEASEGWAAWAWSFVPQMTDSESGLLELTESDSQQSMKKIEQSVFDVGVYIMQASVVFKVCMYIGSNIINGQHYFVSQCWIFFIIVDCFQVHSVNALWSVM